MNAHRKLYMIWRFAADIQFQWILLSLRSLLFVICLSLSYACTNGVVTARDDTDVKDCFGRWYRGLRFAVAAAAAAASAYTCNR